MNREMRRLMEREERRTKNQDKPNAATRRAQAMSRPKPERRPFPQRVRSYFHDVRQELRRVSWPTSEQMIVFTSVTLITTVVLTAVVFGLDVVMKEAVLFVVQRSN